MFLQVISHNTPPPPSPTSHIEITLSPPNSEQTSCQQRFNCKNVFRNVLKAVNISQFSQDRTRVLRHLPGEDVLVNDICRYSIFLKRIILYLLPNLHYLHFYLDILKLDFGDCHLPIAVIRPRNNFGQREEHKFVSF